jgi:MFS family permease
LIAPLSPGFRSGHRASGPVILLAVISALNLTDRFLPAVLSEPIKKDISLSDTALELISGVGFLVIYAMVGMPIARWADRGSYGRVIGLCVGIWSVMTVLRGFAHTTWQLAATRVGVAIGEAGGAPATYAYIARNFPPNSRAAPLAAVTSAAPLAYMLALVGVGALGQLLGWRIAFMVMGIIGLALAAVVALIVPPSQPSDPGDHGTPMALVVATRPRSCSVSAAFS